VTGFTSPRASGSVNEELLRSEAHNTDMPRAVRRTIQFPGTEPSKGSGEEALDHRASSSGG
jgi:hypothetical protein